MRIHALLLAAGAGDRFGGEVPKQFIRLAGETILSRSARLVAICAAQLTTASGSRSLVIPRAMSMSAS